MFLVLLALALSSAPPPSQAEALVARQDTDGLITRFGAIKPTDYGPADRRRLARALAQGARDARKDPAVAVVLAEKAALLDGTAPNLVLLAQIEADLELVTAATEHFTQALALDPHNLEAAQGRIALGARDTQVEAPHPVGPPRATPAPPSTAPAQKPEGFDDLDDSETEHFLVHVSEVRKGGGALFSFEEKMEHALEQAYTFVAETLGREHGAKIPVVLMGTNAYTDKHKNTPEANAGAYWNDSEIVVNSAGDLGRGFTETMVHELTHVIAGDLSGGRIPRWMNEGLAENVRYAFDHLHVETTHAVLAGYKHRDQLPPLRELDHRLAQMGNGVGVDYAEAAAAVGLLVEAHGLDGLVATLNDMKTQSPEAALQSHYGMGLDGLDQALRDAL